MISVDLGKFGKVRISSPSVLELAAFALVLAFAAFMLFRFWH
jgi:ABC-type nickel/cobalt efflux system permease component RcnA